MERGREMVERNQRAELIDKWAASGRLKVCEGLQVDDGRTIGVAVGGGMLRDHPKHFPSEQLIARVMLKLEFDHG